MSKLITKARAGVTLVELLVVILIVTILSVSLLPLLKPYIVKAQYAAEPIPVIGNLRTQIGLFQYDKNYLPGLPKDAVGDVQCTAALMPKYDDLLLGRGGASRLSAETTPIQTFAAVNSGNLTVYRRAVISQIDQAAVEADAEAGIEAREASTLRLQLAEALGTGEQVKPVEEGGIVTEMPEEDPDNPVQGGMYFANHFAKELGINYEDLTGKRMKPVHVQYRVLYGGYKSGTYAYAIGVFGDANGLAAGTGYAVLEIVNPVAGVKYVGTWERYKTVSGDAGQIQMVSMLEDETITANAATTMNCCWLGNPNGYLNSQDKTTASAAVAQAIEQLKTAGWEFQ